MTSFIKLKDNKPLAKGNCRLVFQHPHEVDYLIKVIRPDVIDRRFGSQTHFFRFKKKRRYRQYISFHREVQEYLAGWAESNIPLSFLQEIIGFAKTDLGLGLVVKAIRQENGSLAPTLLKLVQEHRFNEDAEKSLEQFFRQVLNSRIIFSDMNTCSLVYLEELNQFVMIDGLGITNPIPLKAFSSWINRRSKLGRFKRLRKRIARLKTEFNHP